MYRCPIVTGKKTSVTRNTVAETLRCSSQSISREQIDCDWIDLDKVPTQTDRTDDRKDDGEWIDVDEDIITSSPKSYGIQSKLSTTASIRIDSYEEVTRKKAGQIFDDSNIPNYDGSSQFPKGSREHSSSYYPFQSKIDFALAQ